MKITHVVILLLGLTLTCSFLIFAYYVFLSRKRMRDKNGVEDLESKEQKNGDFVQREDLITFQGGEDLTICDILDAPGEVVGKSSYGTLYKALLQRSSNIRLLRFLRPVCTARVEEFDEAIQLLGIIRHPNLVPLLGFYAGPRGEKLMVHPFYRCGNLAQFIRDGSGDSHKWSIIYRITIGIAKGLDYLHTGMLKPLIHGNLKSKNILLDRNYCPYISDYGLHLLLRPTAGQEMLEASAAEGYKAPELIKMRDANEEADIYSLGVILLELLSGKEAINGLPTPDEDFYLPNLIRNAVLEHRVVDLFHPGIVLSSTRDGGSPVSEETILKLLQLALACCSPSPKLRPNIKQVLWKLEDSKMKTLGI